MRQKYSDLQYRYSIGNNMYAKITNSSGKKEWAYYMLYDQGSLVYLSMKKRMEDQKGMLYWNCHENTDERFELK